MRGFTILIIIFLCFKQVGKKIGFIALKLSSFMVRDPLLFNSATYQPLLP